MIINFVGNWSVGYVGEVSDETHLARELEWQGHTVRKIPRDEWREFVISGKEYPNVPKDLKADLNIIAKWHHFYDGSFIQTLKRTSEAPVFYWVWDYMYDENTENWHMLMAREADLYLSGEGGLHDWYKKNNVRHIYFQFDVADGELDPWINISGDFLHEAVFMGSMILKGHRREWLPKINEKFPVKVYSWNYEEWQKLGLDASPAVYGIEFNRICVNSKMNIGMSVEPNCWGYWSNRIGKTLLTGGFLIQEYAPGMEQFFEDAIVYFSTPEEAIEKLWYYSEHDEEREIIRGKGFLLGKERMSSKFKVKQLITLAERYIINGKDWIL